MVRLLSVVLWFVPFNRVMLNRIEWYCELACDDVVLANDKNSIAYASNLLEVSESARDCPAGTMALLRASEHFQRISAVIDASRLRQDDILKRRIFLASMNCVSLFLSAIQLTESRGEAKLNALQNINTVYS